MITTIKEALETPAPAKVQLQCRVRRIDRKFSRVLGEDVLTIIVCDSSSPFPIQLANQWASRWEFLSTLCSGDEITVYGNIRASGAWKVADVYPTKIKKGWAVA